MEELLRLLNHTEILVVHDDHLDGQAEAAYCGQFLDVHLEAAVARDAEHGGIWLGQLDSNGPWQSETHCAQSARGDESTRARRAVTLRCPHLVLANVGQDHAVLWQPAEELVQKTNRRLCQASGVKFGAFRSASDRAPATPVGQRDMAQRAVTRRNRLGQVADDRQLTWMNTVKLYRINFEVHDAGVRRKTSGIAGHAIIQPCAEYQEQVCLVQRHIRGPSAMHPDHAEVVWRIGRNSAEPMHGCECRNLKMIE